MSEILIPNGGDTINLSPRISVTLPQAIPENGILHILRDNVVVGTATQITPTTFSYEDTVTPDRHYIYTARLDTDGRASKSTDYKITAISVSEQLVTMYYQGGTSTYTNGGSNADMSSGVKGFTGASSVDNTYLNGQPVNDDFSLTNNSSKYLFLPNYSDLLKCYFRNDILVEGKPAFTQEFDAFGMDIPHITASAAIFSKPDITEVPDTAGYSPVLSTRSVFNYDNILGLPIEPIFHNLGIWSVGEDSEPITNSGITYSGWVIQVTRTPLGWYFIINDGGVNFMPFSEAELAKETRPGKLTATFTVTSIPSTVFYQTITTASGRDYPILIMRGMVKDFGLPWPSQFSLSDLTINDFTGFKRVRQGTVFRTPVIPTSAIPFIIVPSVTELVINTGFMLTATLTNLRPNTQCEVVVFHVKVAPPQENGDEWPAVPHELVGFKTNDAGVGYLEVRVTEKDTDLVTGNFYCKLRYAGNLLEIARSNLVTISTEIVAPPLTFNPEVAWQVSLGEEVVRFPGDNLNVGGYATGLLAYTQYLIKYFIKPTLGSPLLELQSSNKISNSVGNFVFSTTLVIPSDVLIGNNVCYLELWNIDGTVLHARSVVTNITINPVVAYSFSWTTDATPINPGKRVEFTATVTGLSANTVYYLRPRYNGDTISPNGENNGIHLSDQFGSLTAIVGVRIPSDIPLGNADITCWIQTNPNQSPVHESPIATITVVERSLAGFAFNWTLDKAGSPAGTYVTGVSTIVNGPSNVVFVYSGSIMNTSNESIMDFDEQYITTDTDGTGSANFSFRIPDGTPLGSFTISAIGTVYGDTVTAFTAPVLNGSVVVPPPVDNWGNAGSSVLLQGGTITLYGDIYNLLPATDYSYFFRFFSETEGLSTLRTGTFTTDSNGVIDLNNFTMTIAAWQPLSATRLYVDLYGTADNSLFTYTSAQLNITIVDPATLPFFTWVIPNGQATVVDENDPVRITANVVRLKPNTNYTVSIYEYLVGVGGNQVSSRLLTTSSDGTLSLDVDTVMSRIGFYYGFYEGTTMRYRASVYAQDGSYNTTTEYLDFVIGATAPQPELDLQISGPSTINIGDTIVADGTVINLLEDTFYTIFIRGRDHQYNEFTLFEENVSTDMQGSLTAGINMPLPSTALPGWFEITFIVRLEDTYTEVIKETVQYTVILIIPDLTILDISGQGDDGSSQIVDASPSVKTLGVQSTTFLSTSNPPPGSVSSIAFDGTTNYIIASGVVLNTEIPFSIETDLYLNNNSTGGFGSMGMFNESLYGVSFMLFSGGAFLVRFGRVNNGGSATINGTGTLDSNTWYKIVIVKKNSSSGGVEIWIDNVLRGSGSSYGDFLTNTDFSLGRTFPHENGSYLNGNMANIKIKSGPSVLTRDYSAAPTLPIAFVWSLDASTVKPGNNLTGTATLSNALPSTTYTFNGSIKSATQTELGVFTNNVIVTDGTGFGVATFIIPVSNSVLEGAVTLNANGYISGNNVVVFTPTVLNAVVAYPNVVLAWFLADGQAATVNRGDTVEVTGSVQNLDANTSYRIVVKLGTVTLSDTISLSNASGVLSLDSTVIVPNDTQYAGLDIFAEITNAGATRTINVTTSMLTLTVSDVITVTDPYESFVVLKLRFEGVDESTLIIDEAGVSNVVTVAGDAQLSTTDPIFGTSSLVLTAGWVDIASSSYLDVTATDFTLEATLFITEYPASGAYLFGKDGQANLSYPQYELSINSTGKLVGFLGNGTGVSPSGNSYVSAGTIPLNTAVHVALVKYGSECFGFIGGVKEWVGVVPAMYHGTKALRIGHQLDQPGSSMFNGKMDGVRLTKFARYTSNFVEPGADWVTPPDDTTILINLGGSSFVDASTSTVTFAVASGTPQITAANHPYLSPKSFAFTGNDALSATSSSFIIGDKPFSIEADIYFNSVESGGFGSLVDYTGTVAGISFWLTGGGSYRVRIGKSVGGALDDVFGNTALVANNWYRVAIVKRHSGENGITLYVGGVVTGTGTSSRTIDAVTYILGRVYANAAGEYLNGNIANFTVISGQNVLLRDYTITGADPRTFLSLVRFIGSSGANVFPDEVGPINWSLNGACVLATTQSKFGGSSLFLDSGAFLSRGLSTSFGTGDFTLKGYFYPTTYGSGKMLFSQDSGGISLAMSSTGYLQYSQAYVAVLANASQSPVPLNEWSLVAISRTNNITTITVNGLVAISIVDNVNFGAPSLHIGGYPGMPGSSGFTGFVSVCYAVKGIGYHPGPFTPSNKTFPSFTGAATEVLRITGEGVDGYSNIIDSSVYASTVTVNGAKFSNLAPYSGTNTSVRVTGTDSLYLSSTPLLGFGTDDFTIELKVNVLTNASNTGYNFFDFRHSVGASPFTVYLKNDGGGNYLGVYSASGDAAMEWGNTFIALNTWCNIVLQRAGGRWYCVVDGTVLTFTRGSSTSANGDMGSNQPVTIGYGLQALMSDVVINKGIALYQTS